MARSSRHGSAGTAFVHSRSVVEQEPEHHDDDQEAEDYEDDSTEMSQEQFREAILLEWRERTDEMQKRNDEIKDRDEYSRFEHPSISRFAKATAG